jgi:hypothetical protein
VFSSRQERGVKTKTHFEQVPLAEVKEIVEKPNGSSWKETYQKTQRENDKTKLSDLVVATETAMFTRLQELSNSPGHHNERRELEAATRSLLRIKTDRLGWPPVNEPSRRDLDTMRH